LYVSSASIIKIIRRFSSACVCALDSTARGSLSHIWCGQADRWSVEEIAICEIIQFTKTPVSQNVYIWIRWSWSGEVWCDSVSRDYSFLASLFDLFTCRSFKAGQLTFERYRHLVNDSAIPFVRASGSDRVVQSATNWTAGFATASSELYIPTLNLIIPETDVCLSIIPSLIIVSIERCCREVITH
jgi:hypothetical protein